MIKSQIFLHTCWTLANFVNFHPQVWTISDIITTKILEFGQKRKLVLFNTRELSEVSSIDESTLYTSITWSVYTLYLVYSKYDKLSCI